MNILSPVLATSWSSPLLMDVADGGDVDHVDWPDGG